jgi:hypothetical protein
VGREGAPDRGRAGRALQELARLDGLLDVPEVLAVEADPASGVPGDLGGEAGRLGGSGVGHDGEEVLGHR